MRFIWALTTAMILVVTNYAFADQTINKDDSTSDCPELNLQSPAWPALHENQPGKGWCYAVVAADLLSVEMKTPISASALANKTERTHDTWADYVKVQYYNDLNFYYRFSAFGQNYVTALAAAKTQGLCQTSVLEKLRDKPEIKDIYLDDVFHDLEKLRTANKNAFTEKLHNLFDDLNPSLAEAIDKKSKEKRPLIDITVDTLCTSPLKITNLKLERHDLNKTSFTEAVTLITKALKQNHAVGIGYDNKIFSSPRNGTKEYANHASTIIGQTKDPKDNLCKYILRLTDKTSCKAANPSLNCNQGHLTIPREDLIQATSDLIWLNQ